MLKRTVSQNLKGKKLLADIRELNARRLEQGETLTPIELRTLNPQKELDTSYLKGERVKHPVKHDWGIGQVLTDSNKDSVRVFFSIAGEKSIALKYAQPIKVFGKDAKNSILDNLQLETPRHEGKTLCKNCGHPTYFTERTNSTREANGWCGPCYSHSQRTFEDKETGEKRYFDEFRTVDGIRKFPGSVQ
jgi:hypothetical protein